MNLQCDLFLREKSTNYLIEIGLPASLQGFRFLREAVLEVVKDPKLKKGVTKHLYPIIAEKFGYSAQVVERAMRHAIEVASKRGNFSALGKYFSCQFNDDTFHPCITEIVSLLAERLTLDLNEFVMKSV